MNDKLKMNIYIDSYMKRVKFLDKKEINDNIEFMKGIDDKEIVSFLVYSIYENIIKVKQAFSVRLDNLIDDPDNSDIFRKNFSLNPFRYVIYSMEDVLTAAISRDVRIDMDIADTVFRKGKGIAKNIFDLHRYLAIHDIIGMEKILPTTLRFIIDLTTNEKIVSENIGWKEIFYLLDLYINNLDRVYE